MLLKELEEPAERTVIVLCAPSVEDVLPTIRSRCRVVRLRMPRPGDVAAVLGLSEGAVKMRLLRALERLRTLLGDLGEDTP